jgi:hypothetical protein
MNSNNLVRNGQNNTFVYRFPNSVQFKKSSIAFVSCSMYYSWFNISSSLSNNTFTYNWIDNLGVATTYTVTIPDGLYEISTLNQYLQFIFIQNGHYLVNASGQNVYYAEFIVNPARYAIQINTFLFPINIFDSSTIVCFLNVKSLIVSFNQFINEATGGFLSAIAPILGNMEIEAGKKAEELKKQNVDKPASSGSLQGAFLPADFNPILGNDDFTLYMQHQQGIAGAKGLIEASLGKGRLAPDTIKTKNG